MKILQIAYYYPPMGGAGVQRGLKFSKYLPLHGVQPVLLTAADAHYVQDATLLAEVPPALDVWRVPHTPWLARLAAQRRGAAAPPAPAGAAQAQGVQASRAAHAVNALNSAPAMAGPPAGTGTGTGTGTPASPSSVSLAPWRDALLRTVHTLQWPDDAAGWARRALPVARRVLREHAARGQPIQLIFSSAPPASAHALAERLAAEFKLPWVADFRDLWTDNPAYDAPAWRRALDRRLEDRWLRCATGVVTVTPSWRDLLAARRPAGRPVAFIPNGYDEDDFTGLVLPPRATGVVTLVHTGTFYGPRGLGGLLAGIALYLEGPRAGHPPLRVRLVGNMGARFAQTLQHFGQRHPGVVQAVPYLPHAQALAELMAADALLLVVGGGRGPAVRGWLPGKVFEYLRSGHPVLTLGDPDGDAARLLRRHASGWVVADDDAPGLARALAELVQGAPRRREGIGAGSPHGSISNPGADTFAGHTIGGHRPEPADGFERRQLSGQLADFMRQCAGLTCQQTANEP